MKQKFVYFQPEYVSKFKCDGQFCNAHCCKYWRIDIDKKTYKKYAQIKPKSKAKEITQKIKWKKEINKHIVNLNDKEFCPFLTDDNWCSIQRNYGMDFLSDTCMTYPRKTFKIFDFFERSLTLTCPVAADLVLDQEEPMTFEQIEISEEEHINSCRGKLKDFNIPSIFVDFIIDIQYTVISLLQERSLTIDQRLIVIGFFFEQLEELILKDKFNDIENLAILYTSNDFLREQAPMLIKSIEFNVRDYIKIIFDVFGMLYKDDEQSQFEAQKYLDFVVYMLNIKIDNEGTASVTELVESYNKNAAIRNKLLEKHSTIFENYLVQIFFSGMYPWRVQGSIILNYGVFLVTYKILELISMSMMAVNTEMKLEHNKNTDEKKLLIGLIRWFVRKLDHNNKYMDSISNGLKDKDNIEIMRSLLQG